MYDFGDEFVRVVSCGDLRALGARPLVRVHSSCLASEVFAALDCDCADQLREAMKLIATEGRGVVIHLHQEGRGHGLALKIRAVREMQSRHLDTVQAFDALGLAQDVRVYDAAVRVLQALRLDAVRLITNNPRKVRYLQDAGVRAEMVNTHPIVRDENRTYLATKNAKLGHRVPLDEEPEAGAGPIQFYHSDQPWGALSNFSMHAIFLSGRIWPTVEHFYQARKFVGTPHEEAIRTTASPTLAKRLSQVLALEWRRPEWDSVKEQVMLDGLRAKFHQHPDLRRLLLATAERPLVEHTNDDFYWGDGGDGSGRNRLGALLMAVRSECRLGER